MSKLALIALLGLLFFVADPIIATTPEEKETIQKLTNQLESWQVDVKGGVVQGFIGLKLQTKKTDKDFLTMSLDNEKIQANLLHVTISEYKVWIFLKLTGDCYLELSDINLDGTVDEVTRSWCAATNPHVAQKQMTIWRKKTPNENWAKYDQLEKLILLSLRPQFLRVLDQIPPKILQKMLDYENRHKD